MILKAHENLRNFNSKQIDQKLQSKNKKIQLLKNTHTMLEILP